MAKNEQTFEEFLNSFPKFKDLPKETQDQLAKNTKVFANGKTRTWKVETFYMPSKWQKRWVL